MADNLLQFMKAQHISSCCDLDIFLMSAGHELYLIYILPETQDTAETVSQDTAETNSY